MNKLKTEFFALLAISAAIFFFGSFLGATFLIKREFTRIDKVEQAYMENELKSYRDKVIGDILLQHWEALEISVSRARETLNIHRLALESGDRKIESKGNDVAGRIISGELPLRIGDQNVGRIVFEAKSRLDDTFQAPLLLVSLVFVFFTLILFVFVSYWMEERLFKPIHLLIRSSEGANPIDLLVKFKMTSAELDHIRDMLLSLMVSQQEKQKEIRELEKRKAFSEVASQVAHDIRSPLAALDMITSDLSSSPEVKRIIVRSAVGRIKDIANGLVARERGDSQDESPWRTGANAPLSDQLLPALIDELITEKRAQYRSRLGVEIHFELGPHAYGIFARVQAVEFVRVLSNLIDNSVEAFNDSGRVTISLETTDAQTRLVVRDNGKGIPAEVLTRLGQRGETFSKEGGSGLGLYHARQNVESWGGKLIVTSEVGQGTEVTLALPRASAPHWFVPQLEIFPKSAVVVLDDDTSIHQIWQRRFESAQLASAGVELLHFTTPGEIREWVGRQSGKGRRVLYLFDYELIGERTHGLALIEELGLQRDALLVTSHYEERSVREDCRRLGIRLIPKGMAGFIPIEKRAGQGKRDSVVDAGPGHAELPK